MQKRRNLLGSHLGFLRYLRSIPESPLQYFQAWCPFCFSIAYWFTIVKNFSLEKAPRNSRRLYVLFVFITFALTAAISATACALWSAGFWVRTADTLLTRLFCLKYVENCAADNKDYNGYNCVIDRIHLLILPPFPILFPLMQRKVRTAAKQRRKTSPPTKPAPRLPVVTRVPIW